MRNAVLVDTSALIGLFLESDSWHPAAKQAFDDLRGRRRALVSTSDVFDETVTLVRRWAGYEPALRAGDRLRQSKLLHLVDVRERDREEAWRLFREFREPKLSFTDCSSAAVMGRLGIREVFTFDAHFRKLGFVSLPG